MNHEEERVNGIRMANQPKRAPPHWLDPFNNQGLPRTSSQTLATVGRTPVCRNHHVVTR